MSSHPHYKRRNYFINKEFQGRYIFNYFILAALGSILFIGVFSFFSANTLSITYDNYHLQIGVTPGILFQKILSTQWVFIVLGGIIVVFVTLMLTHRVAGPFFHFEKTLDAMVHKDLSDTIILRSKDEGKVLARKINTFNHMLVKNLTEIENHNTKIAVSSRHLQTILADSDMDTADAARMVDEICHSQEQIQAVIQSFTIPETRA